MDRLFSEFSNDDFDGDAVPVWHVRRKSAEPGKKKNDSRISMQLYKIHLNYCNREDGKSKINDLLSELESFKPSRFSNLYLLGTHNYDSTFA